MNPQKKYNFLIADDEFPILKIISDILAIHPNTNAIFTANDGERAFQLYKNNKIDIVITDILMPRISGIELIRQLREANSESHIIVVSAYSNIDLVRDAIRNGAYDYILKPFSVDEIMFSINRVIDRLKLLEEKKNYVSSLENKVREVTDNLQNSFFDTLNVVLNTLEARSKFTVLHSHNVASLSGRLAKAMGLSDKKIANIQIGGILHDIGKIGVPDSILMKTGTFNDSEYALMKEHTTIGRKIVTPILSSNQDIMDFIYFHHERFDGGGYPEGLKGFDIPQVARIAALVNSYVAMTSASLYKEQKTKDEALEEIKTCSGKQFDPEIAALFIEKWNELLK